jgi:capsular polysaccharide transport system permease protein
MLNSRIAAIDTEIARVQGQMSRGSDDEGGTENGGNSDALANVVAEYQELLLSQEFAEKAYAAALASLERARHEADRTQSYLAVFLTPNVPEDPAYPRPVVNTLVVLIFAAIFWALAALAALTIRDHTR